MIDTPGRVATLTRSIQKAEAALRDVRLFFVGRGDAPACAAREI